MKELFLDYCQCKERIGLNKGSKSVGVRFIEPDPPEAEERVGWPTSPKCYEG